MSAEIDEYPSLRFQDIRKKTVSRTDTRTEGRTDGLTNGQRENSIPHLHKQSLRGGGGGGGGGLGERYN